MTNEMALWLALGASILAVVYGVFTAMWVIGKPFGNEKMQKIAAAIQEGAKADRNLQDCTRASGGVGVFACAGMGLFGN